MKTDFLHQTTDNVIVFTRNSSNSNKQQRLNLAKNQSNSGIFNYNATGGEEQFTTITKEMYKQSNGGKPKEWVKPVTRTTGPNRKNMESSDVWTNTGSFSFKNGIV